MTITQPKKKRSGTRAWIVLCACFIGAATTVGILLYNQTVTLKHTLHEATARRGELQVVLAGLENELYLAREGAAGSPAAFGLHEVRSPRYLSVEPHGLTSEQVASNL